MRKRITLFMLLLTLAIVAYSQTRTTINITAKEVSVASYTDKEVVLNSQTNLHLTATTKPLNNSVIKLNSEDSWIFFDNIRPTFVIDSLLQYITVNNQAAALRSNVRVSIYKHGAVVIPQSAAYQPFKVFTGQSFSGDSTSYSLFAFNNALGTTFDNKIRSFKLKRGYMVTLATSADGMGYSRVYIADDKDLEISVLPTLLDNAISSIRVLDWEWVTKKGWAGSNPIEYGKLNATWRYDWSAGGTTTPLVEYVPIKQNLGWPGWADISGKTYVTHALGYNEPDHTEQSNVTVAQAVAAWPDMIKTGLRIGSPACTNFSWLYQFMDSCKAHNYRVDYVAVHAYWGGKSAANWYNDLKYIHDRTGRPIWITEWNNGANWTTEYWPDGAANYTTANATKQLNDIKAILQVLDTAHFIERYSIYNWVQNARAMVLADTLTLAGKYYAADKSVMAFNKVNEVIPTFTFGNPSLTIAFSTGIYMLNVIDPNVECFRGYILERKIDNGAFTEFYRSENSTLTKYSDALDISLASKVRYRVRSILVDGSITGYSNEVGFDVTNGGDIQFGNSAFSNVAWNPVFFKKAYASIPAIILGSPTNFNSSTMLSPRAKLISYKSQFNIQLAPWAYQNVTSLTKEESVPYFVANIGSYNFGGLKAVAGKSTVAATWTAITFATAFDTIPVVFTTQLNPITLNATTVRVRNVSKTGFEAKLQKESAIKTALSSETVSYFAITPGTGVIDNNKVIVGKTANNTISTTAYTTINYGDSIANPIFLAQIQTCNDDTVTATLRCLTVGSKFANVVKQRERSTGVTIAGTESAGWMVINPVGIIQGVNNPTAEIIKFYPNPVKDFIYLNENSTGNLKLEIRNMLGVIVKRVNSYETKIDVTDLNPGCYVLNSSNLRSTKFIKL